LWFVLNFVVTQAMLPSSGYPVIGLESMPTNATITFVHKAQLVLIAFLFCVLIGCALGKAAFSQKEAGVRYPLRGLDRHLFPLGVIFALVGLVAWYPLALSYVDGARSSLVKTLSGQLSYAITFFLSVGVIVILIDAFKKKRITLLVLVGVVYSVCMFALGGRGRVLWPLVQVVLFFLISRNKRIRVGFVIIIGAVFFFVLQALDPLFSVVYRQTALSDGIATYTSSLNPLQLFLKSTFGGFFNLTTIVGYDAIPHTPDFLLGGSGAAFMSTYFPQIEGVGYPATLPGELWLSGGLLGVCVGGVIFGFLCVVLGRLYSSMRSEISVLLYVVFVPLFSNIGTGWFDSRNKSIAGVLPILVLWIFEWMRNRRKDTKPTGSGSADDQWALRPASLVGWAGSAVERPGQPRPGGRD